MTSSPTLICPDARCNSIGPGHRPLSLRFTTIRAGVPLRGADKYAIDVYGGFIMGTYICNELLFSLVG
ncbi:hypothetical protein M0802_010392 [Mischocyttarus mexicanus]|nr:hypothetical protein M0802_010392 [Mischocyttarus mexicanus]